MQNSHMISLEYKNYKEKYMKVLSQNEKNKKENEKLTKQSFEVEKLKHEIACLRKFLSKFLSGSSNMKMLLKNQRHIFNKSRIGYDKKSKSSKSYTTSYKYCGKSGQLETRYIFSRKKKRILAGTWRLLRLLYLLLYIEGLKYNLLSISQFCDGEFTISFDKDSCIIRCSDDTTLFTIKRNNNLHKINLKDLNK
ncbi:hypothetical protein CR513_25170, partial [Mucuna pruriens]